MLYFIQKCYMILQIFAGMQLRLLEIVDTWEQGSEKMRQLECKD
jgi:hypothetical protein